MAYKMDRKQGQFERGDTGIGKIRFSSDGKKVQAIINVPKGKDEFEEVRHTLNIEDCPGNIELARNAKEWLISMTADGDKMLSFRPAKGVFVVRTKEFVARENEEPTPKTKSVSFIDKKTKMKREYSYEYFTVILEIVEPETLAGLTLPLVLRYQFAEFERDGKSVVGFSMGGKYTEALEEYMLVSGMLEEKYQPMKFKDNLLPDLQRIALHENRKFQITIKDGWIVTGSLIPYDSPDEDDLPFDADDFDERSEQVTSRVESAKDVDFDELDEFMDFEED